MKIFSKKFKLDKKEYQRFLFTTYLRNRIWLYGAFLILGLALIYLEERLLALLSFIYVFLIPGLYYIYFWQYVNTPKNALIFSEKSFSYDKDFIKSEMEDGSASQINWNNVTKVVNRDGYFLLYLSKSQFIPIPESSFSQSDKSEFQELLREKGWHV